MQNPYSNNLGLDQMKISLNEAQNIAKVRPSPIRATAAFKYYATWHKSCLTLNAYNDSDLCTFTPKIPQVHTANQSKSWIFQT